MRILFLVLFSMSIFAQTTQISELELTRVEQYPGKVGAFIVEWNADPGNTNVHGANEYFFVRWSRTPNFDTFLYLRFPAWDTVTELNLVEIIDEGLADGPVYASVAFGWGIESIHDIVKGGGVDGGWTQFGSTTISNSYTQPVLQVPLMQPYQSRDFLLRWNPSNNISKYEINHSSWQDFREFDSVPNVLVTDNGTRTISLSQYGVGIIYFRIRGITKNDDVTEWGKSSFYYDPAELYTYYLPWVADNDTVSTKAGLAILNEALQTTVRIGWTPPPVSGFISETIWKRQDVYQGSVIMVDLAELFHSGLQGAQVIFETSEPIAVTIFYDALEFGDVPIHNAFTLPEGSSDKWLIPMVRQDARHRYSIVVSNHDPERYANVSWMYWFPGYGQEYYGLGVTVAPSDNVVIDLSNLPDIPIETRGYLVVDVHTETETGVVYMIRSEPTTGVAVNSGSSAQQKGD